MAAPLRSVKKARKDQGNCSSCGVALPEGSPYRYYRPGFRSKEKVRVCMKPDCTPKGSSLDQSKMSGALAAQETLLSAIDAATTPQDVHDALEEASASAQEVKDEYEEALQTTPMLEEMVQPLIDALEAWIDEMDGVDAEDFDRSEIVTEAHLSLEPKEIEALQQDKGHDCDGCTAQRELQLDEIKDNATEAANSLDYA